eukprot:jgi/Orpsp1_1/1185346/evm.model.c7180000093362.1
MKNITLLIQFLLILSSILYCNAGPNPAPGINPIKDYIQYMQDDKKDTEYYNNYKDIKRNINFSSNNKKTLDVYYKEDEKDSGELKPVCIFFYGGAWYSGSKIIFTKFGSLLNKNGYVAVLPDYVLFPYGGFEDMVDDVYKSIKWTIEHIKEYGGDPNRITITSFSAGAHLTSLTLLKSLFNYSNKKEKLAPLPEFEKIVLLNGPYDFDDYSSTLKFFNKSEDSIVEKLVKIIFRSKNVSPTDILKEQKQNNKPIDSLGAKKFIFFYTSEDTQVRESSAINFMNNMKEICPTADIKYVYKEGYEHTTITRGVRIQEEEYENLFMDLVNDKVKGVKI